MKQNSKNLKEEYNKEKDPKLKDVEEKEEPKEEKKKDKRKFLILLLLLFLFIFGISVTYGKDIYNYVSEQIIDIFDLSKNNPPEITGGSREWAKERIIKISKDAEMKSGIDYYEYCISKEKSTKKCEWKKTTTKNAVVSVSGIYYVTFRAVDKEGNRGKNSNQELVYIDNNSPIINDVIIKNKTSNSISINVDAIDELSGIEGYYYSIDGKNYEKGDKNHTFKNLDANHTYTIYIKIIDKMGNEVILSLEVKTTIGDKCDLNCDLNGDGKCDLNCDTDGDGKCDLNCDTDGDGKCDLNCEDEKKPSTDKPEELEIPKINLDKVPSSFIYGEKYDLPSYVDFGKDTGTYKCTIKGREYKDTSNIGIGRHLIVCTATSSKNVTAKVEKEVIVKLPDGEDEEWDGYIIINLYYPERSINRQWRLGREGEIRDGYENTDWEDYVGPILIKLDDISNVYIKYTLDGKEVIVPPSGRLLVEIQPEKFTLRNEETTKVKIVYEEKADIRQYRIGMGSWKNYTGEFEVGKNTLIEARVIRNVEIYDDEGNSIGTKKVQSTDNVWISEYIDKIVPDSEGNNNGGSSSSPNTPNDNNGDNNNGIASKVIGTAPGGVTGTIGYTVTSDGGKGGYTKPITSIVLPETEGEAPKYKEPKPSSSLEGPQIIATPSEEITDSVQVTVVPQEPASEIYISINNSKYTRYTEEMTLTKNAIIKAYYIREEDGKESEVSSLAVRNIKTPNLPYVRIDVDPEDYTNENVESVKVKITGTDYDSLEYSLDGNLYFPYTEEITLTKNATIYAKGTNQHGSTVETKVITFTKPLIKKEKLDVTIALNPDSNNELLPVKKVRVVISYDDRAEKKYYKIGSTGELNEYDGPFEVDTNTTIYAYAVSENGSGSAEKMIDYLKTGLSDPIIKVNPTSPTDIVTVTIEYDQTADARRYKIDNGEFTYYDGPFEIDYNATITAENENNDGDIGRSTYTINNIVYIPKYTILDEGTYYLIRLNFPDASTPSSREYKWQKDGVWKHYDEHGILLVKPEYKDIIGPDGILIKDSNNNDVIITDHYYIIDGPINKLIENLYMRWDTSTPKAPTFVVSEDQPCKELTLGINYDKTSVDKFYKIVTPDGEDTGWQKYTGAIKITENNTVVYAKSMNSAEVWSDTSNKVINNIDKENPEINIIGDLAKPINRLKIKIQATDNMILEKVGYAEGDLDKEYFDNNDDSFILNNSTITIEENGTYTFYAEDSVGNYTIKTVEVTNIDKTLPLLEIYVLTTEFGIEAEVEIEYGNSVIKQYSIGNNTSYRDYEGRFTIKSNDVLNLANEDGTLTIYAKGINEAENVMEISEIITVLDLDAPKAPTISTGAGYPTLTEYGMEQGAPTYIVFDTRTDITNYYSIDGGTTWNSYKGPIYRNSGTIMAKSVKNSTGLTMTTTKTISASIPGDALGSAAYDGNASTYVGGFIDTNAVYKWFNVSSEMQGKVLTVTWNGAGNNGESYPIKMQFYNASGGMISQVSYGTLSDTRPVKATQNYTIPNGTTRIAILFHQKTVSPRFIYRLYEIAPLSAPQFSVTSHYPKLTSSKMEPGYSTVKINYFATSTQKLYQINNGSWTTYTGEDIRLELGSTIRAKGIDKYGTSTSVVSYTATLIGDALGSAAYDGNASTYVGGFTGVNAVYRWFDVSSRMQGNQVTVTWNGAGHNGEKYPIKMQYYNASGGMISQVSYGTTQDTRPVKTTQTYTIPTGTTRIRIAFEQAYHTPRFTFSFYEIAPVPIIEPEKEYVDSPQISLSNNSWSKNKTVIINYPEGYTNEYSLDLGQTWTTYESPITIDQEITILARTVKDNEVISTSSFTITKIDTTVPTVELDIPDRILLGSDYELPSKYTISDKTGGEVICRVDGNVINSTKDLYVGQYNIECQVESNETIVTANKNIEIYEEENSNNNGNEDIIDDEDSNNLPTTE